MTYIYDILVDFIDGSRVVEFFEWDKGDIVEHIKKIPLIRVNDDTFFDFINNDITTSSEFLSTIKGKTSFFSEGISNYVALISNTKRAYALEFNSNGNIICKSSLLIDEEEEVIAFSKSLPITNIEYECKTKDESIYTCTRKEEKIKLFIVKEIENAYKSKNYEKITYLYEECFDKKKDNYLDMYNNLLDSLNSQQCIKKLSFILRLSNKKKKVINND